MAMELQKFDMSKIKDDKCSFFVGKRETGKSFFSKGFTILSSRFSVRTVISGTEGN